MLRVLCLMGGAALWAPTALAVEQIYESPDDFIHRSFDGDPPSASALYLTKELKQQVKSVLGHTYGKFRIRYWLKDSRSAWVLEEIGKERPITTGLLVDADSIVEMKVLIFRESRGWEVRYDSFARQFNGARLIEATKLDRRIDGITGATLSVRAVTKLARLALLLHQAVT